MKLFYISKIPYTQGVCEIGIQWEYKSYYIVIVFATDMELYNEMLNGLNMSHVVEQLKKTFSKSIQGQFKRIDQLNFVK